jgi:hypothetical protein
VLVNCGRLLAAAWQQQPSIVIAETLLSLLMYEHFELKLIERKGEIDVASYENPKFQDLLTKAEGMGGGRKRLNILGAYCPQDQEYLDLRLPKGTISAPQVIELLMRMQQRHPETTKFILYFYNARYQHARAVQEWAKAQWAQGVEFVLDFLPAYSPNLNLIERLWTFLCKHALQQLHATYEALQAAVAKVLDHLEDYREDLTALMTERFHLVPETPGARDAGRNARRCEVNRLGIGESTHGHSAPWEIVLNPTLGFCPNAPTLANNRLTPLKNRALSIPRRSELTKLAAFNLRRRMSVGTLPRSAAAGSSANAT